MTDSPSLRLLAFGQINKEDPLARRSTTAVADESIGRLTAQLTLLAEYREALGHRRRHR